MGCRQARFEEETMKEFEAATPLKRTEIHHAFRRFSELYSSHQSETFQPPLVSSQTGCIDTEVSLPVQHIMDTLPELKENPFRQRICEIFAPSGSGWMSFVEFLDMVSAFSPKNSLQQKTLHAFQIFDIDSDGIISRQDIYDVLDLITDKPLSEEVKRETMDELLKEVNKNELADGLSTQDFHYAISRSPDFPSTFSFSL